MEKKISPMLTVFLDNKDFGRQSTFSGFKFHSAISAFLSKSLLLIVILTSAVSCDKNETAADEKTPAAYSGDVVVKWLNMQLNLLRVPLAAGAGTQSAERAQAYCGIALYESIVPGLKEKKSLVGQLTNFPAMPAIQPGKSYHWAAVANATLADINRKLFPTASDANKASIDSLENALKTAYTPETDAETLQRSIDFGKEISAKVFAWAQTDGSANVNAPYVPAGTPGTWVSTPSNFPAAVNPYASQRRLLVPAVATGTVLEPPPPYSSAPGSAFYIMAKETYDKSLVLTDAQKAAAIYNRDAPGYPGGGNFVAVLSQVLTKDNAKLDKAAEAYAKVGIAQSDATIICFSYKYSINIVRPITYIRNEMGHPDWLTLFNTPGHPEFPSAHAVISAAVADALTNVFGADFKFTLNSYDYLGLPARNFDSFDAMSKEMSDSRVYAGIHYQASCDKGRTLGKKVTQNVLTTLKF